MGWWPVLLRRMECWQQNKTLSLAGASLPSLSSSICVLNMTTMGELIIVGCRWIKVKDI